VTPDDELHVIHKAKLIEPTPKGTQTPINLSNYIFWNLSGNFKENHIQNHELRLPSSSRYIEVNSDLIPTGNFVETDGLELDFKDTFVKLGK
jgi:galactose mutarotase-like enzyme